MDKSKGRLFLGSAAASSLSPGSPLKPRYSDRFIPTRVGNKWSLSYPATSSPAPPSKETPGSVTPNAPKKKESDKDGSENDAVPTGSDVYSCLLQNEILHAGLSTPVKKATNRKLFHYDNSERSSTINERWSPYSLSPISKNSEMLLHSPRKIPRRIPKTPFRVLDAPELQDDFYLNLLDWSSQNVLGVGLGASVYLWSPTNAAVTRLCDLESENNPITSVLWNERGNLVAVGTQRGYVQIWDVAAQKNITTLYAHAARVGSLAWNGDLLCSGSRDKTINQKDIRIGPYVPERTLTAHIQEVCGLRWSPDNQFLASGGNDNQLYIWNLGSSEPIHKFNEHTAAVKAIAWSPHNHGILASGGGTADKTIRLWNTVTGQPMHKIQVTSQVCNLVWSKNSPEFVTTHGFSENEIAIWKYPSLQQVAKLTGHSNRVLYLAIAPDGESIVTGAGDETLRFWNVFRKGPPKREILKSSLNLYNNMR